MGGVLGGGGGAVEFKAGKCDKVREADGRLRVVPLEAKGKVRLRDEGGVPVFEWVHRGTGAVDPNLSLYLIGEEVKVEQVAGAPAAARVWRLKREGDGGRVTTHYFWMQEPRAEGDAGVLEALGAALAGGMGGAGGMLGDEEDDDELDDDMYGDEPSLGVAGDAGETPAPVGVAVPPGSAPPAPAAPRKGGAGQAAQGMSVEGLQGVLRSAGEAAPGAGGGGGAVPASHVGLLELLKPELMEHLLTEDPDAVEELGRHLPEAHRGSKEAILSTVRSPQFRQCLDTFSAALQSGQLDYTMFGLQPSDVSGFGVAAFLQAIQQDADRKAAGDAQGDAQGDEAPMEQ